MKVKAIFLILTGVIILSIYNISGQLLTRTYQTNGTPAEEAYDINGEIVFSNDIPVPVPRGNLIASSTVLLPDLYETGKGFTCTGLAYDRNTDTFLVGDIGVLSPYSGSQKSQIVRLNKNFTSVIETIPIYESMSQDSGVQGITIDTKRNTIFVCCSNVKQFDFGGRYISELNISNVTGIAYSSSDDSLWILTYGNKILHYTMSGTLIASFDFAYNETLDQCFIDEYRGLLYITAGTNYTGRNNVYYFNTDTHAQGIACTVDSYSVEGIWLGDNDKMIIVNDGYYHSAAVPYNQANIYTIE